jgi:transcriptional regulator with XRE-family HTH domain
VTKPYHKSDERPPRSIEHEAIGKRIREIREARGLSLHDVTRRGGPSLYTQMQAESGKASVTLDTLELLANVLDVHIVEFFTRMGDESDLGAVCEAICKMNSEELQGLRTRLERKVMN